MTTQNDARTEFGKYYDDIGPRGDDAREETEHKSAECPNCEKTGRLNPVHPGALNLQCNWCWAIIDPAGKIVMLHR